MDRRGDREEPERRAPGELQDQADTIVIGEHLDAQAKDGWEERAKWILRPEGIFQSVEALQRAQANDGTSLGLIKPKRIHGFSAHQRTIEEKKEWEAKREVAIAQKDLFVDAETKIQDLEFRWVDYHVKFSCDDPTCTIVHDFSIRDWGIYVLDRRQEQKKRDYKAAEADVLAKLREMTDPARRDAYFYLGNTAPHPQNFMVVGLFTPPRGKQRLLL